MSVSYVDAPQWLLSSWSRACAEAGATASPERVKQVGEALLARWCDPARQFHDLRHLADVLNRVDELAEETHEPALVRLAAWYHGAIFDAETKATYEARGGENETASAVLAHEQLMELGVPERAAHRVAQLVTALLRHAPDPADFDCSVLCDADLGMLASEPQRYKSYLADVRKEYQHIPARDFVRARVAILTRLLERRALFSSPLGAAWEDAARQNVQGELARLRKEWAALGEDPAELDRPLPDRPSPSVVTTPAPVADSGVGLIDDEDDED
ncbi:HD domain-containing protein [Sanguibacter sp. A247]|uniref:HD domain-containing protein n=1 Tax=unclassified Sanguibacter TaxID=2645534 RepID=UPI003FD76D75